MLSFLNWEMMISADKVGGWVKKGQYHDDVILEWSLMNKKNLPENGNSPLLYVLNEIVLRGMGGSKMPQNTLKDGP